MMICRDVVSEENNHNSRIGLIGSRWCFALAGMLMLFAPHAYAQTNSIQMLPPVSEATVDSAHPQPCVGGGGAEILTWDGQHPIACASGISAAGGTVSTTGNIVAGGTVTSGKATTGAACASEGATAYDVTRHAPIYCNQALQWTVLGAESPSGTWCGNISYTVNLDSSLYTHPFDLSPVIGQSTSISYLRDSLSNQVPCQGQLAPTRTVESGGVITVQISCPAGYALFAYVNGANFFVNQTNVATNKSGSYANYSVTCVKQ